MKARTLILTTGAIFMLAGPAAAQARMLSAAKPAHQARHNASTLLQKQSKGNAVTRPLYIYVPASPTLVATVDQSSTICPDGTTADENCGCD